MSFKWNNQQLRNLDREHGRIKTLTTVRDGGFYITFGSIFDVSTLPNKHVLIESFDIHTTSESFVTAKVWTTEDSFRDKELFNPSEWTLVSSVRMKANGKGSLSNIPKEDVTPVYISPNKTQAFYITLTTLELICTADKTISPGDMWNKNEDILFTTGLAIDQYPYRNSHQIETIWNGVIRYKITPSRLSPSSYSVLSYPSLQPSMVKYQEPSVSIAGEIPLPSIIPINSPSSASKCFNDEQIVSTDYSFDGVRSNFGNMFVIQSKHDSLIIKNFGIIVRTQEPLIFEIFTRQGSYYGYEYDRDEWTKVASGQIMGQGSSQITNIPELLFDPVTIESYSNQAFYISINIDALVHEDGLKEGTAYTYNKYMDITEGNSLALPSFNGGKIQKPVRWQGMVHFDVIVSCFISVSSPLFSLSPSMAHKSKSPENNLPEITSYPSSSPTNEDYYMRNFVTTQTIFNIALIHNKTQTPSSIKNSIKIHVGDNVEKALIDKLPNLFMSSTDAPFIMQPINVQLVNNLKNATEIEVCNQLFPDKSCSGARILIAISHENKISDDLVRFQVLNNSMEILHGLHFPNTYIGPWSVQDEIMITIYVENTVEVKESTLLRVIEHTIKSFLEDHISKLASPYLLITEVQAENMDGIETLFNGGNRRSRTHKDDSNESKYFKSDVQINIFGISRVQVNFPTILKHVFNKFSGDFDIMLKSNSGHIISQFTIQSSAQQSIQQEDLFDISKDGPRDTFTEQSFAGKLTIMFVIEALALLFFLFFCHKTRKARRRCMKRNLGFSISLKQMLNKKLKKGLHGSVKVASTTEIKE